MSPTATPAHSTDVRDPRDEGPPPALVRLRVKRTAVVPTILSVECDVHQAAIDEPCFRTARGVCGSRIEACAERVIRRAATR
ncbi:hypothetical protein ASD93_02455 [Microbacterium sp. Root180]|nr:hypothetical protein ASD93_02455 [Microbacterium sp. Root180]